MEVRVRWRLANDVAAPGRIGAEVRLDGDTLSIWCYSDENIAEEASPLVSVFDERGNTLPDARLLAGLGKLPAKKWTRINLPIGKFEGRYLDTSERQFDPSRLNRILLTQGLDDGHEHVLYIDDVRLMNSEQSDQQPPPAPTELAAEGLDRHVDLAWKQVGDKRVLSYRVYRSADSKEFSPIGTQPGYIHRYVDFVGEAGKEFTYKVSAIDCENRESPLSAPATAKTRPFDDDELLDMVQRRLLPLLLGCGQPGLGHGGRSTARRRQFDRPRRVGLWHHGAGRGHRARIRLAR